jgi:hypothetical protein
MSKATMQRRRREEASVEKQQGAERRRLRLHRQEVTLNLTVVDGVETGDAQNTGE